jgi:hypothetical protein
MHVFNLKSELLINCLLVIIFAQRDGAVTRTERPELGRWEMLIDE